MNISQICYAHIEKDEFGNDLFVDIYPDKIATEMFLGEVVYQVAVTKSDSGKYWAFFEEGKEKPYSFIWHDREKTKKCIGNKISGELIRVKVEKWEKI